MGTYIISYTAGITFLKSYELIFMGWGWEILWDRVSCNSGWPQTHYVVENGLELLVLLPPSHAARMTSVCHQAREAYRLALTQYCEHAKLLRKSPKRCFYRLRYNDTFQSHFKIYPQVISS